MVESPSRPLLNPILRLNKDPRPASVTGGGKGASGIKEGRLVRQRRLLAAQFEQLASTADRTAQFAGRVVIHAAMFDDSFAPTWTPTDLFRRAEGDRLLYPFRSGYLVEVSVRRLKTLAKRVQSADDARVKVDISRVKAVRFFDEADAVANRPLDELWNEAPRSRAGRAFLLWLTPFTDNGAAEALLQAFAGLRDGIIAAPSSRLPSVVANLDATVPALSRRALRAAAQAGDRLSVALREYRLHHRARTTVVVPSRDALARLVASGAVFRIEPVPSFSATSPGEGKEPDRPLPSGMSGLPVVGVVDGGMTASSYQAAEAWRAPPLVEKEPNTHHGNCVTALIVQGHDWNNNLNLPPLYCQVGTVQAIAKDESREFVDPQDFTAYLDATMAAHPDTKVWNFSLNQKQACDPQNVSYLGHEIAVLSRKHTVLPIISVGNKPGNLLQPPADCEAALTVGGRLHDQDGLPAGACPVSLSGPGPSSMLKPEASHFSHVRTLGGILTKGTSFSAALTSPLAAHTMARLREPDPDLVKALIIHTTDSLRHDHALGFGTPPAAVLPWECRPGTVTLQWSASLRPRASYYWELPIPPALRKTGKLQGHGWLTAILNPHPMITDYAGPNYFSVRLATALQYQRGMTAKGDPKFHNLLGSLEADKTTERDARAVDHKWSPLRHHKKDFQRKSFDGNVLRVYARVYARDLYMFDYDGLEDVPELNAVFVLSLGTGDDGDDVYNEMRNQLGTFVETATVETNIEIDGDLV